MPSEPLLSNLPFESACYSITANGVRKLQQQQLRVFTSIKRAAATTIVQQIFYNPFCKTVEDFHFVFPLKHGTRIKEVYCQVGERAWGMPEEPYAATHDILRIYKLLSTIQRRQKIVVNTTIEEKIEYPPNTDAYEWTLPMIMAPPYSSSLPLAYDELFLKIVVDLGEPWTVYAIGSPSHGTVASDGGWIRMVKDEHAEHKAFALFLGKDPQLKKDIVFTVSHKELPQRIARRGPSPPSLFHRMRTGFDDVNKPKPSTETDRLEGSISKVGDQDESTRHQTTRSHKYTLSSNPPSATNWLTPYSPPSTPKSNGTRCSAPSPESPDSDILFNNVSRLLALQHSSDCFNGRKTGFWTLHGTLPEILSISSSTLNSHPDPLKSRVWVTILVIAWFEIIAQDHVDLWLECVQRSRNWLGFVRATGAVKFAGWEVQATDIFSSDEDMEV